MIVPAAHAQLSCIHVWEGTDDKFYYYRLPIIAWQIDDDASYPFPICPGLNADDDQTRLSLYIETEDREYYSVYGSRFDSIDDCIDHFQILNKPKEGECPTTPSPTKSNASAENSPCANPPTSNSSPPAK